MKVSAFFAFREIRRRPRHFLSMIVVSVAIFVALLLLLLYLEAEWRSRVMPDRPENYHFSLQSLTESEKEYIRKQDWVQATYDIYDVYGAKEEVRNVFRVRVTWDELFQWGAHATALLDRFNLWKREPYRASYNSFYKQTYNNLVASWYGMTEKYGETADAVATRTARREVVLQVTRNRYFCQETTGSYVVRPEFGMMLSLFTLFLGSAMTILSAEQYKRNLNEYGSLRALGIRRYQIVLINVLQNLFVTAAAIPVAVLVSIGIVKLYGFFTRNIDMNGVYFTLLDHIPVGVFVFLSILLCCSSLLGVLFVCWIHRNHTVMEMLRGIGTYQISFVAKTSPYFEDASDFRIYNRLYVFRTRVSFLLNTAVIAIMMPLPIYYLDVAITRFTGALDTAALAEALYHAFQAVSIFITSYIVIFVAARANSDGRYREFGVLRALGMSKRSIGKVAYPAVGIQCLLISVLAIALYLNISDTSANISSINEGPIDMMEVAAKSILSLIGVVFFAFPSVYGGLTLSLARFFKRSVIENIRETE